MACKTHHRSTAQSQPGPREGIGFPFFKSLKNYKKKRTLLHFSIATCRRFLLCSQGLVTVSIVVRCRSSANYLSTSLLTFAFSLSSPNPVRGRLANNRAVIRACFLRCPALQTRGRRTLTAAFLSGVATATAASTAAVIPRITHPPPLRTPHRHRCRQTRIDQTPGACLRVLCQQPLAAMIAA